MTRNEQRASVFPFKLCVLHCIREQVEGSLLSLNNWYVAMTVRVSRSVVYVVQFEYLEHSNYLLSLQEFFCLQPRCTSTSPFCVQQPCPEAPRYQYTDVHWYMCCIISFISKLRWNKPLPFSSFHNVISDWMRYKFHDHIRPFLILARDFVNYVHICACQWNI